MHVAYICQEGAVERNSRNLHIRKKKKICGSKKGHTEALTLAISTHWRNANKQTTQVKPSLKTTSTSYQIHIQSRPDLLKNTLPS